jgi:hypothetical protein
MGGGGKAKMDSVAIVVGALMAGGAAGTAGAASAAVTDAYEGLKAMVLARLHIVGNDNDEGEAYVSDALAQRTGSRAALTAELAHAGVDVPTLEAAQRLAGLLETHGHGRVIDVSYAKGLIVGDHAVQHNTFN